MTLTLILSTNYNYSQVRVGDFSFAKSKFKKLNKKNLTRFTEKTTKFILPKIYPKSSFENILNDVWNVTPFELIIEDEFNESDIKVNDALAQFMNIGITKTKTTTTKSKSTGMTVNTWVRDINYSFHMLDFHIVDKMKKKPKENQIKWYSSKIGTIYFTPDISLRKQAGANSKNLKGDLLNFKLGYLKNFLEFMNNCIKNKISTNLYDDYLKPELKNLKNNTLFIDKNFIYGYNPWKIETKESPKIEELMGNYSFDYEVVDYQEIDKMIFNNQSSDFYYLMYNQINGIKIITIINGKTSDIIYQEVSSMSYNMNPKDFKKLDKRIKK